MLCLRAHFGALPTSWVNSTQLKVFSKLGGNFLGFVAKPCSQSFQDAGKAYTMLRDVQARAALLLKHAFLPPRYLAIYVGSHRLTSPSFPFADSLDQEQLGLLGALHGAERIDVVYDGDTDFGVAKASLRAKGLSVLYSPCIGDDLYALQVRKLGDDNHAPRSKLVQPELDVWAFCMQVEYLGFHYSAPTIGGLGFFPGLKSLMIYCCVQKVDFGSIASTCKSLERLLVRLEGDSSSLLGISKLSNLKFLDAGFYGPCGVTLPLELGGLSELVSLRIHGNVVGQFPTEIGQLRGLKVLQVSDTNVSSCIPSEFGNMSSLGTLELTNNKYLHGDLPRELNKLSMLTSLSLYSTPNVCTHLFKLKGVWQHKTWYKTQ